MTFLDRWGPVTFAALNAGYRLEVAEAIESQRCGCLAGLWFEHHLPEVVIECYGCGATWVEDET